MSKRFLFLIMLLVIANSYAIDRPNIVIIMLDDLGYADVGFNGATDILTPNLDELAKNGTIFTNAYTAHPVCGPSRAGMMIGRYPHYYGGQFNVPDHHPEFGVPVNEKFISKILQESGYYTGVFGKWHLGDGKKYQPNQRGFDEFYGILGSGHAYFPKQYRARYKKALEAGKKHIKPSISPLNRNGFTSSDETEYLTDAFSREAVQFVTNASKKDKPFFLYLSYNAPHAPIQAKPEDIKKFSHLPQKRQKYAAMVHCVDYGVKRVIDALKQTKKFDNTLIIFLSDNGGKLVQGASNRPLAGGKRGVNEGGYRVPMFFHWPGKIASGKYNHNPMLALDFYPTLAKLANAKIPAGKKLDGKDIWEDIMKDRNPHKDEMFFAMSHRRDHTEVSGRLNEWKVCRTKKNDWQLFNIVDDIGEKHSLNHKHPERLKQMVEKVEKWGKQHQMPKWFYSKAHIPVWKLNSQPYFEGTFKVKESVN